jgi:hypothetical protein
VNKKGKKQQAELRTLRVKPWLSELVVPDWQELAGDQLGFIFLPDLA